MKIIRSHQGSISCWTTVSGARTDDEKLNAVLSWHESRAHWAESQAEFLAAANQYTERMRLQPENSKHLQSRANAYFFSGNWKNAIDDFSKVTESNMSVLEQCYFARALLMNNAIDAYQEKCRSLVEWAQKSKSIPSLNSILWTYALSNEANEELRIVMKSFETELLKEKDPYPDFYTTLALGCFRDQQYYDAIRYSNRSLNRKTGTLNPDDWLILALSFAGLRNGRKDHSLEMPKLNFANVKLKSPEEYLAHLSQWRENQSDSIFAGATPESYAVQRMNINIPILTSELATMGGGNKH